MTSRFFLAYMRQVAASLPNWYEDNYDFYRFGPAKQPSSFSLKTPLVHYLQRKGIERTSSSSIRLTAAIQLVEAHLEHFEWLYANLADDESREILIKLLAFRALGYRKVKLPLNTPDYWAQLAQMPSLAVADDSMPLNTGNDALTLMDLHPIGLPVRGYFTPSSVYHQFILQQYRCLGKPGNIEVQPGDYVIDAGACWGDTAIYFANHAGPTGRIFSFEFVPDNLALLRRNLALNGLEDSVRVVERAVWDQSDLPVIIEGKGTGSRVRIGDASAAGAGLSTLSIDDLVKQENLPKMDFIKMDIEGAELHALHGAQSTLQQHRPRLAISVYHRLTDFFEIPQFLDSLHCGYRFFLRHYTIHAEETVLFADVP